PARAFVLADVDAVAATDKHAPGVGRVYHQPVNVLVHPRYVLPGLAVVVAAKEPADLDAHVHCRRPRRVEGDLLGVGHVGWRRKAPFLDRRNRPEVYEFAPAPPEVIAEKQARRLRPNVNPRPAIQRDCLYAEDLALAEAVAASFPAAAAVTAHSEGAAAVGAGKDCAALRFDEDGADVLVGQ